MSSELAVTIASAVKDAMRARNAVRLQTLRLLQAAIKQKAIDERVEPDDQAIMAIIEKQAKQRRESISAFESAGRIDSANQERAELEILQEFLPQAASAAELDAAIKAAIQAAHEQGKQGAAAMGLVMTSLKQSLAGRADMALVSKQVKSQLSV